MRYVVFIEVLAVVQCLEPELAESLALGVGPDNAIQPDEASETYTIEAVGIEDSGGVADAFSKV